MDTNENNSTSFRGIKRKYSDGDESRSVMPKYENNQEKYDALIDDVIIRIVEYQPITQWLDLEKVDQKFQRAVHSAWRGLRKIRLNEDFISNRKYESNEILKLILKKLFERAPNLISIRGLDFYSNKKYKIDENSVRLLARFKYLTHVSICNRASITVKNLAQFLATSASRDRLKELNVIIIDEGALDGQENQNYSQLLRDAFENIPDRLPLELEKLYLEMPRNNNGIGSSYDFLNVINVHLLTKLDLVDRDSGDIYSNDLAQLIGRCRQLKELYFNFICPTDCQGTPTNPHGTLIESLKNLENLSVLWIGYKSKCTGECYNRLSSKLIELLKYFGRHRRIEDLSITHFFGDSVIEAITDLRFYSTSLHFHLDDADGESIKNLMQRLINLKKLIICGSILFDEISTPFVGLKNLEGLYFDHDEVEFNLIELTRLENLKEIQISNCHLNETALKAWNRDAKWKLELLQLPDYRESMTNEFLSFIEKMTGLRRLDLSQTKITDTDLKSIAKICPLLIELILNNCKLIAACGVQKIIDGCTQLKQIEIPRIDIRELKFNKYRNIKFIHKDTSIEKVA